VNTRPVSTLRCLTSFLAPLGASLALVASASAQNLGLIAENANDRVFVFDADSLAVLGSVNIATGTVGDVLIEPTRMLGFVTDFQSRVWVIDLAANPPALAAGDNRINISNPGEDLALSPDGNYLVVTDGTSRVPVSVIGIDARAEVAVYNTGQDVNSVEVAPDGSVLIGSHGSRRIHRLLIAPDGSLVDTGETLLGVQATNVAVGPFGAPGVVVGRANGLLTLFDVGGMIDRGFRVMPGTGVSAVFNAEGDRLYVRTINAGAVEAYDVNPLTGAVDDAPMLSFPVANVSAFFGIEQMALHPEGEMLYVSEPGGVAVYDALNGARLSTITAANMTQPTGVTVADCSPPVQNIPPVIERAARPKHILIPNHRLIDASSSFEVYDEDGDELTMTFTVYSDEPEWGRRSFVSTGMSPDFKDEYFEDGRGLLVRAERDPRGDGRVYVAVIAADDGRGGVATMAVAIAVVPRIPTFWHLCRVFAEARELEAAVQDALDADLPIPADLHEVGVGPVRGGFQ